MKANEIYLPCLSFNYQINGSAKHERWDAEMKVKYNGTQYTVHYCSHCCRYISHLSYDYGYFTKILHFLFIESGIFFPLTVEINDGHIITHYPDDDCLTWVKKYDGRHYEAREELLKDKSYELVCDDNYNLFFAKKQ